jgi:hypothetical protein
MAQEDITTKVLAVLGSIALGFAAMINSVAAAIALVTGDFVGAFGDANAHAAWTAKAIAIAFAVLAALEFIAGELLRRRIRNAIVPVACGATVAGWVTFGVWARTFTAIDATMIGCALFAAWTWWRLPRPDPEIALAAA